MDRERSGVRLALTALAQALDNSPYPIKWMVWN